MIADLRLPAKFLSGLDPIHPRSGGGELSVGFQLDLGRAYEWPLSAYGRQRAVSELELASLAHDLEELRRDSRRGIRGMDGKGVRRHN